MRHIRRPRARIRDGHWGIGCDCGWEGRVAATRGPDVKPGEQVSQELNDAFVAHLPTGERESYVMVDQRPGHEGNWIMPVGRGCQLLKWWERDGVREVRYRELEDNHKVGVLPVGEVRTACGRVIRLDA